MAKFLRHIVETMPSMNCWSKKNQRAVIVSTVFPWLLGWHAAVYSQILETSGSLDYMQCKNRTKRICTGWLDRKPESSVQFKQQCHRLLYTHGQRCRKYFHIIRNRTAVNEWELNMTNSVKRRKQRKNQCGFGTHFTVETPYTCTGTSICSSR